MLLPVGKRRRKHPATAAKTSNALAGTAALLECRRRKMAYHAKYWNIPTAAKFVIS
jgi:hypothetical protein